MRVGILSSSVGTLGRLWMPKKRGYSRAFTPRSDRRVKFDIDRIPPTLAEKVQAKCRRDGISLRALTLTLWQRWADGAVSLGAEGAA